MLWIVPCKLISTSSDHDVQITLQCSDVEVPSKRPRPHRVRQPLSRLLTYPHPVSSQSHTSRGCQRIVFRGTSVVRSCILATLVADVAVVLPLSKLKDATAMPLPLLLVVRAMQSWRWLAMETAARCSMCLTRSRVLS